MVHKADADKADEAYEADADKADADKADADIAALTGDRALVDRWLDYKRYNQGVSGRTAGKYRQCLLRLTRFLAERGVDLLTATPQQLHEFVGLHLHKEGHSPRSRRPSVAAVRGFYDWAYRTLGAHAENLAAKIPYPNAGEPLPIPMGLENAEKLLMEPDIRTLAGLRDAAIFSVLIGCGPRVSGLCAMNEQDLQWFRGEDGTERLIIKLREKGKKERLVPAPFETGLLLRAYLGHPDLDQIDRTLPKGDRVLWVNFRNSRCEAHEHYGERRRLTQRGVHDLLLYYGRRCGLPADQCHPHALRHTYGTELAEAEVDMARIQMLMGHAKASTTELYIHLSLRRMVNSVDKGNPLGKISTPVSELAQQLRKQQASIGHTRGEPRGPGRVPSIGV